MYIIMDYLPVHLYQGVKKLQNVYDFLTVQYDHNDPTIAKMKRLIEVSVKRIQDMNRISANALEVINAMEPSNLASLSIHLYNLQTHLCA
jgi:hypothetical protein